TRNVIGAVFIMLAFWAVVPVVLEIFGVMSLPETIEGIDLLLAAVILFLIGLGFLAPQPLEKNIDILKTYVVTKKEIDDESQTVTITLQALKTDNSFEIVKSGEQFQRYKNEINIGDEIPGAELIVV
ncbi:hypothetical protein KAK05_02695, partial [Candidatus Parcubacteria bacterium]|nr:hypothetical protein [Candidatus Parcubacteria bacterium]